MKRSTKMMLMGSQYGRSKERGNGNGRGTNRYAPRGGYDRFPEDTPNMIREREWPCDIGMRTMPYLWPGGGDGRPSLYGAGAPGVRRIGYDANMDDDYDRYDRYRHKEDRHGHSDDEDDDEDQHQPWQNHRMYAAGVAWAEPSEEHSKKEYKPIDEKCAHKWVSRMENADGTVGGHYKPEQAEQLRVAHCPQCQKWEWFVALNMAYSDYAPVGKKLGVDRDEFYAGLAKAFLMDKDAGEHKLSKYMDVIPEHAEAA